MDSVNLRLNNLVVYTVRACKLLPSCLFVTPWTVARQAPLSMGFSRQEYWSGLPCPPPGDLPDPGIEPASLMSPALANGIFTTSAPWEAQYTWLLTMSAGHSWLLLASMTNRFTPCLTVPQGYASSWTLCLLAYQVITMSWRSVVSNVDITKIPSMHLKIDFIALPLLKVRGNVYIYYDQLGSHSKTAQSPAV